MSVRVRFHKQMKDMERHFQGFWDTAVLCFLTQETENTQKRQKNRPT